MNVLGNLSEKVLQVLQSMVTARAEEKFTELGGKLYEFGPFSVILYYQKNWKTTSVSDIRDPSSWKGHSAIP